MKLTYILSILLLSVCAMNATAQDIIKLKDSTELTVRIVAVTPTKVIYKNIDTLDDYRLTLNRTRIERINYANGVIEIVDNDPQFYRHLHSWALNHKKYGRDIVSLSLSLLNEESEGNKGSNFPSGFGVSYEHIFGKKGKLSFYLPLTISFYSIYNESYDDSDGDFHTINFTTQKQGTHSFFMMYPGIKFYPRGSNHRFTYDFGSSLAIGFGRKYNTALVYTNHGLFVSTDSFNMYRDSVTAVAVNESKPVFKAGLLFTGGINYMATKNIAVGLEFGLGFSFINNEYVYDHNFTGDGDFGTFLEYQFNFKVGYRF